VQDGPAGKASKLPAGRRGGWDRALWIKAAVPVGLLVMGCALWIWFGGHRQDALGKSASPDMGKGPLSYSMTGTTWKGTLKETYPARGDMETYEAGYEASVVVGEDRQIQEVRWTDIHSPLFKVTVVWNKGNVMVLGEEREGGTPVKMLESMSERLRVQRSQSGLSIVYSRPRELEMELGFPDTLGPKAEPEGEGSGQSVTGSVTVNIPIRLLQEGSWAVPSERISRFAVSPQRVFSQCRCPGGNPQAGAKDYLEDCTLKELSAFSGGSTGVYFSFNLSHVAVSTASLSGRNGQVVSPETVRLGGQSTMELLSHPFERNVQIRLEKDGRGTLEVKDRRLQPSGNALVFALEKT
jgi:hypothetical protein